MDTIERHLASEALARLVEETPDSAEAAHLARCGRCRGELDALAEDRAALGALPDLRAPRDGWRRIGAALTEEGEGGRRQPWHTRAPLRLAAGIALFLSGLATGALATGIADSGDAVATATPAPVDAGEALAEAEAAYLEALARHAGTEDEPFGRDATARLVALESIVQATGVALQHAPADPVINGYHLSARGQRDETLRHVAQLASAEWYR
jgi:hypothetical protein